MTDAPEAPEPITKPNAEAALAAHGTNPWAIRDFRLIWLGRLSAVLAIQIQSSALLWQVYEIARRDHPIEQASLYLGLVGLFQFIPLLALTLPAGEMADRRNRRTTVMLAIVAEGTCAAAFLAMALHGNPPLWGLLAVAFGFGASRAFLAPASQAFLPMVVGRAALPRAIAAQSIAFPPRATAGPAPGGVAARLSAPAAPTPAGTLGIDTGTLAAGMPADLVLIDPDAPWQIVADAMAGKAGNTPFDGLPVQGKAVRLFKGGSEVA